MRWGPRVIWAGFLAAAAGLAVPWICESVYEGRITSEWLRQLRDGETSARDEAAKALGAIGVEALPGLLESLEHQNPAVRIAALRGLEPILASCLDKFWTKNCVTGYVPGRGRAVKALEQMKKALARTLADADPGVRRATLRLITATRGYPASQAILPGIARGFSEQLDDPDPAQRIAALGRLENFADVSMLDPLAKALRDQDKEVRGRAALATMRVLRRLQLPEARRASLQPAVPDILAILNNANSEVFGHDDEQCAALALAQIGDPRAVVPMIRLAGHRHELARSVADRALEDLIEKQPAYGDSLESCVDDLAGMLRGEGPPSRDWAIRGLIRGGPRGLSTVSDALNDKDEQVRRNALDALFMGLRGRASELLARAGPAARAAVDRVILEDARNGHTRTLERLGDEGVGKVRVFLPSFLALVKSQQFEGSAEKVLRRLSPDTKDALGPLVAALDDKAPAVRLAALFGLTSLGPGASDAVPSLVARLKDPEAAVRRQAAEALRAIGLPARTASTALEEIAQSDPDKWARDAADAALLRFYNLEKEAQAGMTGPSQ